MKIKQLFARYNNLKKKKNIYIYIFEYEVNLILFVSYIFFSFILKYDVDCFNLVLI